MAVRDTVYSEEWLAERLARSAGRKNRTVVAKVDTGAEAATRSQTPKRDYKAELLQQLDLVGIKVEPEFQFLTDRMFRADWRVINTRVLIEFDGGLFKKGKAGHSSVAGILRDMEKINLAVINGWTVIRVAPNHVVSGQGLKWIESAIASTL